MKPDNACGIFIETNGSVTQIKATGRTFKLDEMQRYVGGYIERIQVDWMGGKADLICNEEGKLHGLALNRAASEIAHQPIVGNCLLLRKGAW
jgi:hypothetical protein